LPLAFQPRALVDVDTGVDTDAYNGGPSKES
jgi:hypothetical protein